MGSIVRAPAAPLSQLVDTIWDWDMPRQVHRFDRMLPSACGQLVINLVEDESRVYDAALRCRRFAGAAFDGPANRSFVLDTARSEEHTPELQSLMRNPYAVFCLKKKIRT